MEFILGFCIGLILATVFFIVLYRIFSKQQNDQFKLMAQEVLGQNSEQLNLKMTEYKDHIHSMHITDIKDRESLREKINFMLTSAKKIETETGQLSRALSSDVKFQGAWGELTLERILELAGLTQGIEFFTQEVTSSKQRPDVIIKLPGEGHIIIDSKVSLTSYFEYENTVEKQHALKLMRKSVLTHIDSLSKKNYQLNNDFKSLEFVYLFIPVEGVYATILKEFPDLFDEGIKKNVVIVSPVNLLANLKTVASLWRLDKQSQNAEEMAQKAGAMYDKFASMVDDFEKIGLQIDRAKNSYDDAFKKLSTGKGSLLRRSEELKELGAKTSKQISIN